MREFLRENHFVQKIFKNGKKNLRNKNTSKLPSQQVKRKL